MVGDLSLDFCAHTEPGPEGISWGQTKLSPATESSSNDSMGTDKLPFPLLLNYFQFF